MSTSSSLSVPRTPEPEYALVAFGPLISWALLPIHDRSEALGIESPSRFIRRVLFTEHARGATLSELRQLSTVSSTDVARFVALHKVIQDAGWLTWEEYCYLIVATSFREGGAFLVFVWLKTPKRLAKELHHLESIIQYPCVEPYVPVLKKVIKRFRWDTEMRRKYPETMNRRFLDFKKSGLTLNFTEPDLERDEKSRLDAICKVGQEPKSAAAEKVVLACIT
jgi:hypothetical protein